MRTVYADSPSQAFSINADLDQRSVGNYLNSVAQNNQARLQAWDRAAQQAAAQRAEEQQQQNRTVQLAEYLANQRQAGEAETYRRGQDTYNRGQNSLAAMMQQKRFDLDSALQKWQMGQPSTAQIKASADAQAQARDETELATQGGNIANYMNQRDEFSRMLGTLPSEAEATVAGEREGFLNLRSPERKRLAFSERLSDLYPEEVLNAVDFNAADKAGQGSPLGYRNAIQKYLQDRDTSLKSLIPTSEVELNKLVRMKDGRYESLRQGPGDVFDFAAPQKQRSELSRMLGVLPDEAAAKEADTADFFPPKQRRTKRREFSEKLADLYPQEVLDAVDFNAADVAGQDSPLGYRNAIHKYLRSKAADTTASQAVQAPPKTQTTTTQPMYFRTPQEAAAAGITPGTQIMAFNPRTQLYEPAIWRGP